MAPIASSQQAITAEEAYFVYGFGAAAGMVTPWVDPLQTYTLPATKGTTLNVELDGGRIILKKDVTEALKRVRGKFKLAEGFTSTDEAMRAIRGRAPGDPLDR